MSKFARWAALAVFCAAFGFGGSVGGIALMQDHLRGDAGAPGSAGPSGPQGPPGRTGPAGPAADTAGLQFDLDQLSGRVDNLEGTAPSRQGCAMVTELVTDVTTFGTLDPTLNVSKTPFLVCVNPGP